MLPPVIGKTASLTGAWRVKQAKTLAEEAQRNGQAVKSRIQDGYILRGIKQHNRYVGQVLDTPQYLLYAGLHYFGVDSTAVEDAGAPTATRDRFVYPAPGATPLHVLPNGGVEPTVARTSMPGGYPVAFLGIRQYPQLRLVAQFFTPVVVNIPTLSTTDAVGTQLDQTAAFTFGQIVSVRTALTSFFYGASGLEQQPSPNYFNKNVLWIDESALPSGWTYLPRRLTPQTSFAPGSVLANEIAPGVGQPTNDYSILYSPLNGIVNGVYHAGGTVHPAEADAVSPQDKFCVAARVCNQNRDLWANGTSGARIYYDRTGDSGVLITQGHCVRSGYTAGSTDPYLATVDSQRIVRGTSLDMPEIRPFPVNIDPTGYLGKTTRPNPSMFTCIHPVWSTSGWVVFSLYTSQRYAQSVLGEVLAVVTSLPNGTDRVLKAEWNIAYPNGTAVLPPTASTSERAVPWIIGADSARAVAENGDVSYTATALVWEQRTSRSNNPAGAVLGGNWVVYSVESGDVTRTVLTQSSPIAPLFAPQMDGPFLWDARWYVKGLRYNEWFPTADTPTSSMHWAGLDYFVTACIDRPYAVPTVDTSGYPNGLPTPDVAPHDIRCAVVSIQDNTVEARGVIAQRSMWFTKCHVTVLQHATATSEPILLASVSDESQIGNTKRSPGKVYLSNDGGWNWSELVTDLGAQGGAFFVGSRLWQHDPANPIATEAP